MKRETKDAITVLVLTAIIAGTVYEYMYLKTKTFDFTYVDFFFVLFLHGVLSIKAKLQRIEEKCLEYATFLKIFMEVKFGIVTLDDVKDYFIKLKENMEKNK